MGAGTTTRWCPLKRYCRETSNAEAGARRYNRLGANLMRRREQTGQRGGLAGWDPGRQPAGEEIVEVKGPVEAMDTEQASSPTT